ncbi:DUF6069 family protein [Brachybacterium halotolerans subsp. kimchii]|uniref:DUF6069 family protein n=1 Tax=Brachybacterium halotolerans TaxID=2795215 RepID=UPI001E3CD9A1|nr:DUF6069 family protein [Brachybacterium halotolerans]UEJ84225.1 DUF6069 family protein [Brachybacterium halotolerans subsp. kimchii]
MPQAEASWPGGIPPVEPRPRSSWPGAPRPAESATQGSGGSSESREPHESPASTDSRPQAAKRTASRHDASRSAAPSGASRTAASRTQTSGSGASGASRSSASRSGASRTDADGPNPSSRDSASRETSRSTGPRRGPIDTPRASRAIATLVLAVLAAILVWVVATPIAGLDLHAGGWSISPGAIIPAVLVPGILAWVLRIAFEPSPRGPLIWTIITVVVLALSLLGPVVMGASGPILLALLTMHLVVGIVLVVGLRGPRGTVHVSRTPRAQEKVGPL